MVKLSFPMKLLAFLLTAGALFAQLPLKRDPKDVVAIIDGRKITREEVQQILFVSGPQFEAKFFANPQIALYEYFLKQELGKRGAEMKLDQQSPLKERLEAIRTEMLADSYVNYEMNTYQAPAAEVEKFYNANKGRYQRVRVSGVFVKYKPKPGTGQSTADLAAMAMAALNAGQVQRSEEEARAIALDVVRRLKAGEDLGKLAEEISEDDASKNKKGDIGYVKNDSNFPEEFKVAALALQQGQISEPVSVGGGFYVLRADERRAMSLTEAAPEIQVELRKEHLDSYMKELNERLRPEIVDPTLIIQPAGQKR